MARTVYYCACSLDGYIAEADDGLDWLTSYQGSFDDEGAEPNPTGDGVVGGGGVASQFAAEERLDELRYEIRA